MASLLLTLLIGAPTLIVATWIAGAIYYDVGRMTKAGVVGAVFWCLAVIGMLLFWQPAWQPLLALVAVCTLFVLWWYTLRPSHEREWNPDFSQLPWIRLNGDSLTIENVRNNDYEPGAVTSRRFERREYRLSEMCGLDVMFLYWGSPMMCHPMFIFDFGSGGRVCISVEVRYRQGQVFSVWRSLFRQQELMYVVCDERDAILRRTRYLKNHELYLYRVHADGLGMRQFFLDYATSINALALRPRWYHGLTANCTTIAYRHGRDYLRWNWRLVLNGTLDRLMYDLDFLDRDLPFDEFKRQSLVNDVANAAPVEGFGDHIRRELPGYRRDEERRKAQTDSVILAKATS